MKIKNLNLDSLSLVKPAVNPKHGYFSHILIEAQEEIVFTATNGNVTIRTIATGDILEPGSLLINAEKLSKIAGLGKPVNIEIGPQVINVTSDRSKLKFPIVPTLNFGKFEKPFAESWFEVNLNKVIPRTVFAAAATGSGNPTLESVCMQFSGGGLCFVATNRNRLSEYLYPLDHDVDFKNILIPADGLRTVKKVLEKADKHEVWGEFNGSIYIRFEQTDISLRLIDGEFPDYTAIIPKEIGCTFEVDVKNLLSALEAISIAEGDKHFIGFKAEGTELKLWAHDGPYQASETITITETPVPLNICFNSKYLIDALEQLKTTATFSFHTEGYTVLIQEQAEQRQIIGCVTPLEEIDELEE